MTEYGSIESDKNLGNGYNSRYMHQIRPCAHLFHPYFFEEGHHRVFAHVWGSENRVMSQWIFIPYQFCTLDF